MFFKTALKVLPTNIVGCSDVLLRKLWMYTCSRIALQSTVNQTSTWIVCLKELVHVQNAHWKQQFFYRMHSFIISFALDHTYKTIHLFYSLTFFRSNAEKASYINIFITSCCISSVNFTHNKKIQSQQVSALPMPWNTQASTTPFQAFSLLSKNMLLIGKNPLSPKNCLLYFVVHFISSIKHPEVWRSFGC